MQNTLSVTNVQTANDPKHQNVALPQLVTGSEFATFFQGSQTPDLGGTPVGVPVDFATLTGQETAPKHMGTRVFEGSEKAVHAPEIPPETVKIDSAKGQNLPSGPLTSDPQTATTVSYPLAFAAMAIPIQAGKTDATIGPEPGGTTAESKSPVPQNAAPVPLVSDSRSAPRETAPDPEILSPELPTGLSEMTPIVVRMPIGISDGGLAGLGLINVQMATEPLSDPGHSDLAKTASPVQGLEESGAVPKHQQDAGLAKQTAQFPSDGTPRVVFENQPQKLPVEPGPGLAFESHPTIPVVPLQAENPSLASPSPAPVLAAKPGPASAQVFIPPSEQSIVAGLGPNSRPVMPSQPPELIVSQQTTQNQAQPVVPTAQPALNAGEIQTRPQETGARLEVARQQTPNAQVQPAPLADIPPPKPAPIAQQALLVPGSSQGMDVQTGPAPNQAVPVQSVSERQGPGPASLAGQVQSSLVSVPKDNNQPDKFVKPSATESEKGSSVDAPTTQPKSPELSPGTQERTQNFRNDATAIRPPDQQMAALVSEAQNAGRWSEGRDLLPELGVAGPSGKSSSEAQGLPLLSARHDPAVARNIAAQIAEITPPSDKRPVDLTLNPEELGRVRLVFTHDKGHLMIFVNAERPETLDLMRRHIETLAQELKDLGYGQVSFGFEQSGNQTPDQQAGHPDEHRQPDPARVESGTVAPPENSRRDGTTGPMRNLAGNVDIRF